MSTRTVPLEPGTWDLGSQEMASSPSIASWFKDWDVEPFPQWDVAEAGRKNGRPEPLARVPSVHCLHGGVQGTHKCTQIDSRAASSLPLPPQLSFSSLSISPKLETSIRAKGSPKGKKKKFFWLVLGFLLRVN